MIVQKTKKQPKKSAPFGGGLLVLFWGLKYNHFLDFQNKKYRYWVYLMEHICFEVQLCIKISIFNEFCENWWIYHPTLSYSLHSRGSRVPPKASSGWTANYNKLLSKLLETLNHWANHVIYYTVYAMTHPLVYLLMCSISNIHIYVTVYNVFLILQMLLWPCFHFIEVLYS